MSEEFFSRDHKRLLDIATWIKYLAWGALIYYIIRAALVIVQYQVDLQRQYYSYSGGDTSPINWIELFRFDPFHYSIDLASNMASALLSGAIYYLALKGISLGLNMIVETDINYREKRNQGGDNE